MRLPAKIALGALGLVLAAQAVPVRRDNPPVEADLSAPPQVKAILKRACYDCHSHETVWAAPQSFVAPVSWLVAHDVKEGREELNFSRWDAADQRLGKRARKIAKEVAEHDMPPWIYLLAHPEARLSEADRTLLVSWADGLAR